MTELEKFNQVCLYLIVNGCLETNSTKTTVIMEDIMHEGKNIGSYSVTVKKIK